MGSTGNVTVPLCVAFEVVIEFFSLLSEASEPITKLLGKFFVVEIFRRVSWFRIKSGSVSPSRFDLWLVVVDPSERRTAPGAICTPDRPPPNVWFTNPNTKKAPRQRPTAREARRREE